MHGAEIALKAAKKFRKPLINRMGYLLSDAVEQLPEFQHFNLEEINKMQKVVFNQANKIIVTTEQILNRIKSKDNTLSNKLSIIPNYVDIKIFNPKITKKKYDIIFIGRISEQKNLSSLLQAVENYKYKLLIIGSGVLKEKFLKEYGSNKNISWLDRIPNYQIPKYMNESKIFVLPSLYEGHPKILIEAMSCGMITLASNVDGNNEVIQDGLNGYLCEPTAEDIEKRLNEILMLNEKKLNEIKIAAREYAEKKFSIEKVVDMELELYNSIFVNQ